MKLSTRRVITVSATLGIMIGSVALTQTSIAATTPTGPDSGDLSTSPSTFFVGDSIAITANFADSQRGKLISFYKETPAGSGQYDSIGTKTANSSGNGSLTGYTINATQKVFARTSAAKETEIDTLTPKTLTGDDGVISACADRDDGELSLLLSTACSSSEKVLSWSQQGEKGEKGEKGETGPPGPSGTSQGFFAYEPGDVTLITSDDLAVVSKPLPAGKYMVTASVQFLSTGADDRAGACRFETDEEAGPFIGFKIAAGDDEEVTFLGTVSMAAGEASLNCSQNTPLGDLKSTDAWMSVIKVDAIG
jgi:hypothetical protein